jgi:hypothetical protein
VPLKTSILGNICKTIRVLLENQFYIPYIFLLWIESKTQFFHNFFRRNYFSKNKKICTWPRSESDSSATTSVETLGAEANTWFRLVAELEPPEEEVAWPDEHSLRGKSNRGPMLWFFKYFRRKIQQKHLAFLTQNKSKLSKTLIITLVFEKNAIFCRKLSKIAENCHHNIDHWVPDCLFSNQKSQFG